MSVDATRELLSRYYGAFNRRDWPTFLGLLTDDVIHDVNQGGREIGKAAFEAFMDKKTDEGLPEASGQTYRLPAGAFFDIRDGKVARVTNYYNLNDWLKQVGA